jgi:hypothetical protein
MNMRHYVKLLQLVAIGAFALAVAGCVQQDRTVSKSTGDSSPYSGDRTLSAQSTGSWHYYRDDTGRLYHVDPQGGLHVIDRKVRVEPATGGLYTIIDDNNTRYYYDETNRLYYRDDRGDVRYIEESAPSRVIDPLPLLRGEYSNQNMRLRSVDYCTGEWRSCMDTCKGSTLNRKKCLENCDFNREQCLQPY